MSLVPAAFGAVFAGFAGYWSYVADAYVLPAVVAIVLVTGMTWLDVVQMQRMVSAMPLRKALQNLVREYREGDPETAGLEPLIELGERQAREGMSADILLPFIAMRGALNLGIVVVVSLATS